MRVGNPPPKGVPIRLPLLVGPRLAVAGGPGLFVHLSEIPEIKGSGSGKITLESNVREDIVKVFKDKGYTEADLLVLQGAFDAQERLGIDLMPLARNIEMLLTWGVSPETVAAFMLYSLNPAVLAQEKIDKAVIDLITQSKNIDQFPFNIRHERKQGGKLVEMIMLRKEKPEVLLLRIAEIFRQLSFDPPEKTSQAAYMALHAFSKLLKVMGFKDDATQLEDLAFMNLQPEEFETLESKTIELYQVDKMYIIEELKTLMRLISDELERIGIKATVSYRPKGAWSRHNKPRETNDLFGLLVVVEDGEKCYLVQSAIKGIMDDLKFSRIKSKCDNYIANPKESGYQALHENYVENKHNWPLEIQIKDKLMHHEAEVGRYSHIGYKNKEYGFSRMKLGAANAFEVYNQNRKELKEQGFYYAYDANERIQRIGPVIREGNTATVLDFAFRLGQDTGTHCTGAEIRRFQGDGTWQTIHLGFSAPISNGDIIRLKTSFDEPPISEGRLNAANTPLAIVLMTLMQKGIKIGGMGEYEDMKDRGKKAFEHQLKEWEQEIIESFKSIANHPLQDISLLFSMERVYKKWGFSDWPLFYLAYGMEGKGMDKLQEESMEIIKESSIVIGCDPQGIDKGEGDFYILMNGRPGVLSRFLKYLKELEIDLKSLSIKAEHGQYNLIETKLKFEDKTSIEKLYARLRHIYRDLHSVSSSRFKQNLRIRGGIAEKQMLELLTQILELGGNIVSGGARPKFLSRKLDINLEVVFPVDRFETTLARLSNYVKKKSIKLNYQ